MPQRLHRYYGAGYSHFITASCYRRLPLLGSARNHDLFLRVLEQVRQRYHFVVLGYVVMPEHVHLLLGEPQRGDPSAVMKALKQGFARRLLLRHRRTMDAKQMSLWQAPVDRGRISVLRAQAGGEDALHAPQSREARISASQGTNQQSFMMPAASCPGFENREAWGSRFSGDACSGDA